MKKIVVIGGESTGKTSLSKALATYYQTSWAEEFARRYLIDLDRPYSEADLCLIAKGQLEQEKKATSIARAFYFCDTDLQVIQVWSEYKYNRCDIQLLKEIAKNQADAYILTTPSIPWEYDAFREHPNEKDRWYFFNYYKSLLIFQEKPFIIVEDSMDNNMLYVKDFISKLFIHSV